MANLIYNMVCDTFAGLISRRAAENLVKDALRDIGRDPDHVTAVEMQELLRKGIFKRLQKVIPTMQAKGEIRRLLRKLEKSLGEPKSTEDWEEEVEAVHLGPWTVTSSSQDALASLVEGPSQGGGVQDSAPTEKFQNDSNALTPLEQDSQPEVDLVSNDSDSVKPELLQGEEAPFDSTEDFSGDFSDLFDFDSDQGSGIAPLEAKPILREYAKQEEILERIASEPGVTDILLSTRETALLNSRVSRIEPRPPLCQAIAEAARGADGGMAPELIYIDADEQLICIVPLDDQVLLTVFGANHINIGKLFAEIVRIREGL